MSLEHVLLSRHPSPVEPINPVLNPHSDTENTKEKNEDGVPSPLPSEEETTQNVSRAFIQKSGPNSGPDSLTCAEFARQPRFRLLV